MHSCPLDRCRIRITSQSSSVCLKSQVAHKYSIAAQQNFKDGKIYLLTVTFIHSRHADRNVLFYDIFPLAFHGLGSDSFSVVRSALAVGTRPPC